MAILLELRAKAEEKRAALRKVLDQAGDDLDMSKVDCIPGLEKSASSKDKVRKFQAMNEDLDAAQKELEQFETALKASENLREFERKAEDARRKGVTMPEPSQDGQHAHKQKGLFRAYFGDAIAKAGGFDEKNRNKTLTLDGGEVNLKTTFSTSAGWAAETLRTGRVVEDEQRPVQVLDLIPLGQTSQAAVVYMEETTFTSAAAEAAEAAAYAESTLALTEQSETVRKIATVIPVTDEQLQDVAQVQGYLNRRLEFMLRQRLDNQVINGNGTPPNLTGILNKSGINTQALGSDDIPSALYRAGRKVRVTGRSIPSGVIIHPNNWETVRLMKTNDGIYLWGHPAEPGPDRIWGWPVAQADSIAAGTAIVGDFRNWCELVERRGIEVRVGYNNDDFTKGKQSVRADLRVAFVIYRPAAFTSATGLGS